MRKSVLVTGSSRGIGKAIALRLARDDYDIVLHCRSRREEADSVARSVVDLGRQAPALQFHAGQPQTTAAPLKTHNAPTDCYYRALRNAGTVPDNLSPAMS